MTALAIRLVQFDTEDTPVHRRVRAESRTLQAGTTIHVEVGADWDRLEHIDRDWRWAAAIIERVEDDRLYVRRLSSPETA